MFQSIDGKGFSDIKTLALTYNYEVFRDKGKGGTNKLIFCHLDTAYIIKLTGKMNDLYYALTTNDFVDYIKKNAIETTTKNALIQSNHIKISKSKVLQQKKQNEYEIEQLLEQKTNIVLQLMNLSLKRGSKEHQQLKNQLLQIRAQLQELGYKPNEKLTVITQDEIELIHKRKQAKKEKKEKIKQKSKKIALVS